MRDRDRDSHLPDGHTPDSAAPPSALALPNTAEALTRHRARAVMWCRIGLALLTGSVVAALAGPALTVPTGPVPARVGVLALCLLGMGLGGVRLSRRMRRQLAAAPWTACDVVSVPRGPFSARMVLRDPATGELWPLTPVAAGHRYHQVRPGPSGVVWWCGDPGTGGVIAPEGGGGALIWTRAVRQPGARLRAVRAAERAGLSTAPGPV
ncbi:hypothetical protein [Streptomyces corynorhini]|uniref:Uncharacterized protein n=1 Tax=Streptomyces corynorhini TaxID=2282652 RepID=A0A370B8S4_9ACTN|nr:hypothetical protein [Streptomyces corynorhini]RDG38207.1 hypothetical protein DVH02_10430 [Streptomyces corynorhini]